MEPAIVTAIITAIAAVAGGVITAFASHLNTRHKIREIELTASQKLREHYLQNAREYTHGIYIPLTLAISSIADAYNEFERNKGAAASIESFREAIDRFTSEVKRLRAQGAEAFLTNELEDRLRSFADFLDASRNAAGVVRNVEVGFRVGLGGIAWASTGHFSLAGRSAAWSRIPGVSLSLPGVGITYEATVVRQAPPGTIEFATRFAADTGEIRYLIKEVTLGGKPRDTSSK